MDRASPPPTPRSAAGTAACKLLSRTAASRSGGTLTSTLDGPSPKSSA